MFDKVRTHVKKAYLIDIFMLCVVGLVLISIGYALASQDTSPPVGEGKKPFIPVSSNFVSEATFKISRSELGTFGSICWLEPFFGGWKTAV